jgi:hypothetical protein
MATEKERLPQSGPRVKAYFALGLEMHEMAGALHSRWHHVRLHSLRGLALGAVVNALLDLAELCEKATGLDRLLDGEIWREAHGLTVYDVLTPEGEISVSVPYLTASLDAAMTLVPEGWVWRHEPTKHVPHLASVAPRHSHGGYSGHSDHSACLALCAASLRARAASVDRNPKGEKPQALSAQHESAAPEGGDAQ